MKLLLDENLPKRLKQDFPEYDVFTVRELGWNGITNGALLKLMLDNEIDVLMTFDKNLQHQQNLSKYPVSVFVLTAPSNQYDNLKPLVEKIRLKILEPSVGITIIGDESNK